jgi:hypothetical protein
MKLDNIKQLLASLTIMVLAGCGSAPIQPVSDPSAAIAYGNITLPEGNITSVLLNKVGVIYAPPFKSPPEGHVYTNGNFFFENLEPGKYFIVGFMAGQNAFYFNYYGMKEDEFMKKMAIEVKPGSTVYLGSYKVSGITHNFIQTDTFNIEPSKTPSRSTILKHLIDATKGTGWDERLKKAMK